MEGAETNRIADEIEKLKVRRMETTNKMNMTITGLIMI